MEVKKIDLEKGIATLGPGKDEITIEQAVKQEKERILLLLLKEIPHAVNTYKAQVKHTGGLLTASMGYAYERGLRDALKIITKENKV